MGLRVGFRAAPHVYFSVPLGHARRLAGHRSHGERFDPVGFVLGVVIMWVFLKVCWAAAWGPGG
jgi:hypothetical protein